MIMKTVDLLPLLASVGLVVIASTARLGAPALTVVFQTLYKPLAADIL